MSEAKLRPASEVAWGIIGDCRGLYEPDDLFDEIEPAIEQDRREVVEVIALWFETSSDIRHMNRTLVAGAIRRKFGGPDG